MVVPLTVTAIVLPGPTAVGTADASAASTLVVELFNGGLEVPLVVPFEGVFELFPDADELVVELLLLPPPPPPQAARLRPSTAAIIHAILRTCFLSIDCC